MVEVSWLNLWPMERDLGLDHSEELGRHAQRGRTPIYRQSVPLEVDSVGGIRMGS
jgi:hypothetical protein